MASIKSDCFKKKQYYSKVRARNQTICPNLQCTSILERTGALLLRYHPLASAITGTAATITWLYPLHIMLSEDCIHTQKRCTPESTCCRVSPERTHTQKEMYTRERMLQGFTRTKVPSCLKILMRCSRQSVTMMSPCIHPTW